MSSPGLEVAAPREFIRIRALADFIDRSSQPGRRALGVLCFTVAYIALALLAQPLTGVADGSSSLWIPVGLAGPVLALSRMRMWLPLMGAIVVAETLVDLHAGSTLVVALMFGVINVIEAVVFAAILKWRSATSIDRARDVLWFTVAALIATFAAGVLGSWSVTTDGGSQFIRVWRSWTNGDLIALVCIGALVLRLDRPILGTWKRRLELTVVVVLLCALITAIFEAPARFSTGIVGLPYLILVLLVWLGVKFGAGSITPVMAVMAVTSVSFTLAGLGPYTLISAESGRQIATLQEFLCIGTLTALAITVLVEERRRVADNAQTAIRLMNLVLDTTEALVYVKSYDDLEGYGRYVLANHTFVRTHGTHGLVHEGRRDDEIFGVERAEQFRAMDYEVMQYDDVITQEDVTVDSEGELKTFLSTRFPVRNGSGRIVGIGGMSTDITGRKKDQAQIAASERMMRAMFDRSPVATARVGISQRGILMLRDANLAMCRLVGLEPVELAAADLTSLLHPNDRGFIISNAMLALAEPTEAISDPQRASADAVRQREIRLMRGDGREAWVRLGLAALGVNDDDGLFDIVIQVEDVTARRDAEATLTKQALYDAVTGLLNRHALVDRLDAAIRRLARAQGAVAVLFVDLDNFKEVNDTLGHGAGDLLLEEVAVRLRHAVRPEDTVSRHGGDEFVIVCEKLHDDAEARVIADRAQIALSTPWECDGRVFLPTMSIGIATTRDSTIRAEDLLRRADLAMYRAKAQGRNRADFYHDELEERVSASVAIQTEMRQAVAGTGLIVHYQPIVNLGTGDVVDAEALVRIQPETGDLLYPASFIDVAESTGLVVPIGGSVLRRAMFDLSGWLEAGAEIGVSVNVSPRQLRLADFAEQVLSICAGTGVDPARLTLEVTEQAVVDELDPAYKTLKSLRDRGVHVAIDDFGTGYSSLTRLKSLPADIIKIDRSFVAGVVDDSDDTAIVGAVVQVAHDLGLLVVAEGVETQGQADAVTAMGCDWAQGWLYGRPVPVSHFDLTAAALSIPVVGTATH